MLPKEFNNYQDWHKTIVKIRFADLDKLAHVNNAKYLTYIESARIEYFQKIVGEEVNWSEKGIILAKASIDFLLPIQLEDVEVFVYTKCTRTGNKSFDLSYVIAKDKGTTVVSTGSTAMVCFNYTQNKTIEIPEDWRAKLEKN